MADGGGSTTVVTYNYNSDGSYHDDGSRQQVTLRVTHADGSRIDEIYYDARGRLLQHEINTPSSTDTANYSYYADGTLQMKSEATSISGATPTRTEQTDYYNPDGSRQRIDKDVIQTGGSRTDWHFLAAHHGHV